MARKKEEDYSKYQEQVAKSAWAEMSRRSFWSFCLYYDPEFFTDGKPHLKLVADRFQDIYEGRITKLAISMPPRAGKSYITSLFCAWMLGKDMKGSIMRNCYGATLAEKFSRDIRDGIIQNQRYKDVFEHVKISRTHSAVEAWSLSGRVQPSYFCAGVGGAITGLGCKSLAILDDPIKNIEDAMSETIIDKTWDWYTSTHLSRLEKGCKLLHIATRWSNKDPIGRLTDPDSEVYDPSIVVVKIPALDSQGRSFCEEIKTTKEYHEIRKVTDSMIWEAEYMQNPIEEKGLLFPINELNRFKLSELKGDADYIAGFTDPADQGADYLCSLVCKKYRDRVYVVDTIFTQDGVEVTEPLVAKLMTDNHCREMHVESNSGGKAFAQNVQRIIDDLSVELSKHWQTEVRQKAEQLKGYHVYFESQTQNKETRILMNAGYIKEYFCFRDDYEPGSDYDRFMRQFTSYVKMGKNKHDDAADCITSAAEFFQNQYIPDYTVKVIKPGVYHETELEDLGVHWYDIQRFRTSGSMINITEEVNLC